MAEPETEPTVIISMTSSPNQQDPQTLLPNTNTPEQTLKPPMTSSQPQPNTLLILDDDVILPPPSQPLSPPPVNHHYHRRTNTNTKRKSRKPNNKSQIKRIETLTQNLKPIPFNPTKNLDFIKHEQVLKKLGLFDFSRIEFDKTFRNDLIAQLILSYDAKKRCGYVNEFRIQLNRADLARALKLPAPKAENKAGSVVEVDLDNESFSDEAIGFVDDFVFNWLVLNEGWEVGKEVEDMTRCIRDGHPEKMDTARLIWWCVEKELSLGGKVVECYYAPHLQFLIKSQRPGLFVEVGKDKDSVGKEVSKEIVKVEDDNENEEKVEVEVKDEKIEKYEVEMKGDDKEIVKVEDENMENVVQEENVIDEMEENEVKDKKEEKEEENLVVEERDIELTLETDGTQVKEIVHEEVKVDEVMADAEEFKVDEVAEEQGTWKLDGMDGLGEHFLQRCQSSDVNNYGGANVEDVEEEQIEEVDDDEEEEEEEEEAGGERVDEEGFNMEANDDSMDRDGLTGDFLRGVETNQMQYNNHGMSSMDLFGSRDGLFMSHGGPSFFSNGGKRVMEAEDDMHILDGSNKRVRTNEMLDQNPNDFGFCMEQMQQWMEKAKMVHESKEQSYANSQYSQQLVINQLQERQNYMEVVIKSKDDELEKKNAEVYRLERELYLMSDLLAGYRNALKDTRFKFTEYRKRAQLQETPLYQDVGPGGLVLSTREIERRRLKLEEDKMNFRMVANNFEEECVKTFKMYEENIMVLADKLAYVGNEFEKLKEIATWLKETRKHQKSSAENDMTAEVEDNQKSMDEVELSAVVEENQMSMEGVELSADVEQNQESLDGKDLSADVDEKQELLDDDELGAKPEEMQTDEQDEVLENDAKLECVLSDAGADADANAGADADESKEKGSSED